ncbi:MAG TPA: FAD-dependent oxidoreductase, partial [Woeseiaceae bacterium]|nr:FAD-dependent oxidoreductase [Woeseiaceae bacterium]
MKTLAVLGVSTTMPAGRSAAAAGERAKFDVLVVGAGVFGIWSAWRLQRAGRRVAVIDAVAPAHGRASSGGESRVIRAGYGDRETYSEWAWRSLADWQALSARSGLPVFHPLGVLWLHEERDALVRA